MYLNSGTESQINTDANAILRQIAVTFPQSNSMKDNRSYMLGEVAHIRDDEVHIKGYIRQNYLNAKRLIHITGFGKIAWSIKRIEVALDPCPVKLTRKEKDSVMSTSKAQSIVSSRNSSRMSSRRDSLDGDNNMKEVDPVTGTKCVQAMKADKRDDSRILNDPGLFAAE